jgi:uncharacterized protein YceH (UPF0502 family)
MTVESCQRGRAPPTVIHRRSNSARRGYIMGMQLTNNEARVLGCLLEKERTTPENYPLSLLALTAACNQSTNREPVMSIGERDVEEAVNALREQKLASVVFGAGARVQKYRHTLPAIYNFSAQENALLCVLLLRGPQTPGELRARAERLAPFASLGDVESALEGLAGAAEPLVRVLPARPGQKERRYVQLLAGEPAEDAAPIPRDAPPERRAPAPVAADPELVRRVEALELSLGQVREELAQFRKQFE